MGLQVFDTATISQAEEDLSVYAVREQPWPSGLVLFMIEFLHGLICQILRNKGNYEVIIYIYICMST